MEAVIGLLVMLLGVSHCVVTHCDGRQDRAQCYGALGGAVVLQLIDNLSDLPRYQLFNKSQIMLDVRRDAFESNLIADRSLFTPNNGTFVIYQLSRTDGGEYKFKTFDSNGLESVRTLQLTIQAPVSSVQLVPQCLSQGEVEVSCSSQGADSPQYSWTLDGKALTDFELLSGNTETHNITLRQHVSGRLVCSVWNNVSRDVKDVNISTCGFIYINCTSSNGTHISQWVYAANNILQCIEPTAVPTTITATSHPGKESGITVSIKPNTNSTSPNNTLTHPPRPYLPVGYSYPLICGVCAAVVITALIGIIVFFAWKKKRNQMAEGSVVRGQMEHQGYSVVMLEVRSSASEL